MHPLYINQLSRKFVMDIQTATSLIQLNTTDLSMQEIAEKCGFTDANYFTRTFKKFQGMTPLKYRLSLINGH